MEYRYFLSDSAEAKQIIEACITKIEERNVKRRTVLQEYGADTFVASRGGHGNLLGIVYKEKQESPWLKLDYEDKVHGFVYKPKRNIKRGRALSDAMQDEGMSFIPSEFLVRECHAGRCLSEYRFGQHILVFSTAGFADGVIFLKIPDNGQEEGGDPFPDIPGWLREVKESEWLMAQGK